MFIFYDNTSICRGKWWCCIIETLTTGPTFSKIQGRFPFLVEFHLWKSAFQAHVVKPTESGLFVCNLCNNRIWYMEEEFDWTHKMFNNCRFKNNTCYYQGFIISCHIQSCLDASGALKYRRHCLVQVIGLTSTCCAHNAWHSLWKVTKFSLSHFEL